MLNPASPLGRLIAAPIRPGKVVWIGLRPGRREPPVSVSAATAEPGRGLLGDRYKGGPAGRRQVTLIQQEDLAAIAAYMAIERLEPGLLRRNIVVAGINLLALKECWLRVGDAVLQVTGECHPCSRMEENLGTGGYNAVRGHGGITARIVSGGTIQVGDAVTRLIDWPAAP